MVRLAQQSGESGRRRLGGDAALPQLGQALGGGGPPPTVEGASGADGTGPVAPVLVMFDGEAEQFRAAQRRPGPAPVVPQGLGRRVPQLPGQPRHLVHRRRVEGGELPAQQHRLVGGRLVRLVKDRSQRRQVDRAPAAQQPGGPPRPVVLDLGEQTGQGGALCAYLLDGGVVRPGGAHQPLVGVGQRVQAEDGEERVEELALRAGGEPTELGGREERPVQLQRAGQAQLAEAAVPAPLAGHAHLGVGQLTTGRPGPRHPGRRGHAVDPQLHTDPARVRGVQVAPPGTPHAGLVGPAGAVAGEGELDGLGEARLAGAVAADDEGDARPGCDVEGALRADAAEPGDGHRLQPDPLRRLVVRRGPRVEPAGVAGEGGGQVVLAGERGEDQFGGVGLHVAVGGESVEDQLDQGLCGLGHGRLQEQGVRGPGGRPG
nr:hypothetical protein [Micromonospora sp. 4G55]